MKHALISPNETVYSYDGTPLGQRVAEVVSVPFEVAPPLFWVECAEEVAADRYYYAEGTILPVPVPPQPVEPGPPSPAA